MGNFQTLCIAKNIPTKWEKYQSREWFRSLHSLNHKNVFLTDWFPTSWMWHLRMICLPTKTVWLRVLSEMSIKGRPEPLTPLLTPNFVKYSGFLESCRNFFPCSIAAALPNCRSGYLPILGLLPLETPVTWLSCCHPEPANKTKHYTQW